MVLKQAGINICSVTNVQKRTSREKTSRRRTPTNQRFLNHPGNVHLTVSNQLLQFE